MNHTLKQLLITKAQQYNQTKFIESDPICIPHRFSLQQDIEIAGFFAATLAWGNRTSIINSCTKLMQWMGNTPYHFILHHKATDLKPMLTFVHRTFNATDLLYFIDFLQRHYLQNKSLESAFVPKDTYSHPNVTQALLHFKSYFFEAEHPQRTEKHISSPAKNAACKRINMFLRWMVRKDNNGVDFGLWQKINMSQLVCPLDVHVANVACRLGLLPNEKSTWKNALSLTEQLKLIDKKDPSQYDFALFGLGAEERLKAKRF